jgi:C1q domain
MALTKITATNIGANAAANSIGYVPVNKAGDTITGKLLVNDGSSSYTSGDANGYPRFTGTYSSAQVGLFRGGDSIGGMYIGADSASFSVWDNTFTRRLTVTQSGAVTAPYQPSFFAYKSNGGYTGNVQVIYNGTNHNVGNCYSTSTGRFTAPVAGRYLFSVFSISSSSGGTGYWSIRKNGSNIAGADWSGSGYVNSSVTCVIDLAVNDYVDVQNVTGTMYGSNTSENCFSGHLLG